MSVSPGYLPAIMFTGSREESTEFSEDGTVVKYSVKPRFPYIDCPECGEPLISNGNAPVKWVRDLPSSGMQVVYEVHCKRYRCPNCGKTCSENLDCIFDGQMTKRLKEKLVDRVLLRDTFSKVAADYGVSDQTVRRAFFEWATKHEWQLRYETPRVLGLDEAHIDDHFRLVVTDIEKNLILDMLPNNKTQTVIKFLRNLPNKDNVKVVTMDFADGYALAVRRSFPFQPLIVIDRFHVVQLLNRKLDMTRKRIHREEKARSEGTAKRLKHERTLFMANLEDLDDVGVDKLCEWLKEYPLLEKAYGLKEQFRAIYSYPERAFAEHAFDDWCAAITPDLPEFESLRDTFQQRREHILNYFDARYTNAYTESANNIIKGVEKQGKGYDFDTLKKIVLFSCRNPRDPNAKPRTLSFRQDHMQ